MKRTLPLLLLSFSCVAQSPPSKPVISISVQGQATSDAPAILSSPAVAQEADGATLVADVTGSAPLAFQWILNGAFIDGATNAAYVLDVLERADEGAYSVVVTNRAGRTTSDSARLFISNVKPASFMSLLVPPATNGVLQIQYADSLASNAVWRPLVGLTSSLAPLVIIDPGTTNASQRFYKTPVAQGLKGRFLPGWSHAGPSGSIYAIESIEPQSGLTKWRMLEIITNGDSGFLFVDATATNGVVRSYRTTMLESPAGRRVGQLAFTIAWALPPDVYSAASQSNRQVLAGLGIAFNDQDYSLQSPTNAVPGGWIVIGDQRVMTDSNGNFQIDVPAGATNGFALLSSNGRSTQAQAAFSVSRLALPGQSPVPIVLNYVREGLPNMNMSPPTVFAPAAPIERICGNPCGQTGNQPPGCCLDYDGLDNDGCMYVYGLERLKRYFGSTCWRNTILGHCFTELASGSVIPFARGPICFENHKYRDCQNIVDNDLSMAASATTIACGQTINLTIRNNTFANKTTLRLGPSTLKDFGTITGSRVSDISIPFLPWTAAWSVQHYDDDLKKHFEDSVVQYTAPTREQIQPDEGGTQRIRITARAGLEERSLEFILDCCGQLHDPSAVPIANMVYIPPGTFIIGTPDWSEGLWSNPEEIPPTPVKISCGFYMSKYEVTQGEYQAIMGGNPELLSGQSDPSCGLGHLE